MQPAPTTVPTTAFAGAAASYVLCRIAARAGTYAPGIQDEVFDELRLAPNGSTLDDVTRWISARGSAMHALGYRLHCRRITTRSRDLLSWVDAGCGLRGAVLAMIGTTVAITFERGDGGGDELVVIDPASAARRAPVDCGLARSQRNVAYRGLALHWTGWA
jgi:hypothetical protein